MSNVSREVPAAIAEDKRERTNKQKSIERKDTEQSIVCITLILRKYE